MARPARLALLFPLLLVPNAAKARRLRLALILLPCIIALLVIAALIA